jgi:hypothetical protein
VSHSAYGTLKSRTDAAQGTSRHRRCRQAPRRVCRAHLAPASGPDSSRCRAASACAYFIQQRHRRARQRRPTFAAPSAARKRLSLTRGLHCTSRTRDQSSESAHEIQHTARGCVAQTWALRRRKPFSPCISAGSLRGRPREVEQMRGNSHAACRRPAHVVELARSCSRSRWHCGAHRGRTEQRGRE